MAQKFLSRLDSTRLCLRSIPCLINKANRRIPEQGPINHQVTDTSLPRIRSSRKNGFAEGQSIELISNHGTSEDLVLGVVRQRGGTVLRGDDAGEIYKTRMIDSHWIIP